MRSFGACILAFLLMLAVGAPLAAQPQGAFGKVIRVDRAAFQPTAGLITFDEYPLGTVNPVYLPQDFGGVTGGITIRFGGYFEGQFIAAANRCPSGARRSGCVDGTPSAPLSLAQAGPEVFISTDSEEGVPRMPVLTGSPQHNGPVSMVFSADVAGVGLAGGYFDTVEGVAIRAFDRGGRLLGGVVNQEVGVEYLALVTEDGANRIAGVQFSLVGEEPAGFAIDDVTIARIEEMDRRQIPGLAAPPPPQARAPSLHGLGERGAATDTPPDRKAPSLRDLVK